MLLRNKPFTCSTPFLNLVSGSEKSLWVSGRRDAPHLELVYLVTGFGTFGNSVFGQLAGQQQAHSRLHLPGRDGRTLVVVHQTGGLASDALEDVFTNEFMMPTALEEIPVSGCTCFYTLYT